MARSAEEEAVRGVGFGVKGFGGWEGDDDTLVAAWLALGDERSLPHRAVPLKPVKVVPWLEASFGRCRAVLTSLNSSWAWSDSSGGAGPRSSSSWAEGSVNGMNCDTDELDSTLPDSNRRGLALMILCAELSFWYIAKAVLTAWPSVSCYHHYQPLNCGSLSVG